MSTQQTLPRSGDAPEAFLTGTSKTSLPAEPTRRRFRLALLLLLGTFGLLYVIMFPLLMIPALRFDRWGGLRWVPVLDYSFHAQRVDADVLIYGDSTAFLGVDPLILQKQLGVKAAVIPNTIGSLTVTGELALRSYLAHNKPPKLIVFYFTPWDLDYEHRSETSRFIFEGEEELLRNGTKGEIVSFMRAHPLELLMFPLQLNSTMGLKQSLQTLRTDRGRIVREHLGHIAYTDAESAITPPCVFPARFVHADQEGTVRRLMERYATSQTKVVLYLAPMPSCGGASEIVDRNPPPETAGVRINRPVALPAEWFASDGLYSHILPPHVGEVTQLISDALRAAKLLSSPESQARNK